MDRVLEKLTGRERALVRIRCIKAGTEEPAVLTLTEPPDEWGRFDRLMDLFGQASRRLGWCAVWLRSRVETATQRMVTVSLLRAWSMRNESILEHVMLEMAVPITASEYEKGRDEEEEEVEDWDGDWADVPAGLTTYEVVPEELADLAERLRAERSKLVEDERVRLAIEQVLAEVSNELGGEEPLMPAVRAILDEAKEELEQLGEGLATYVEDFALPAEPNEAVVNLLSELVNEQE